MVSISGISTPSLNISTTNKILSSPFISFSMATFLSSEYSPSPVCTDAVLIPAFIKASVIVFACLMEVQKATALLFPKSLKYFKTNSALLGLLSASSSSFSLYFPLLKLISL